jgi:arylsulfatase A-like enzyme
MMKASRRDFLKAGMAGAALAALPHGLWADSPGGGGRRPNFLVLLADDLGYGRLGYEGNQIAQTPRLDALAAGHLRLDRCYAAHSLCAPSRTAIMTGRCAYRVGGTGGFGGVLSPQETTLSKALHDHGYRTGHFGKWHMWVKPDHPQYALDEYLYTGNNCGHVNPGYDAAFDGKSRTKPGRMEGDDSEIIVRRSLEFVDRALEAALPGPVPGREGREGGLSFRSVRDGFCDRGVLLDELAKRNVVDNTVIFFAGDNGYGGGVNPATMIRAESKQRETISNKGGMGEGAIRVPGIFHWPARWPKPARIATPVAGYDLMPTFLAAAGAENAAHRPFDGENVLPVLDGQARERSDLCFWCWGADPGASYLMRADYRLWCGPDDRQILQQIGPDNLMQEVKDAALEKETSEKLSRWRESVQTDNKQALAEAAQAGRNRKK